MPFLSVTLCVNSPPPTAIGRETFIPLRPRFGRIESTRLNRYTWYAGMLLARRTTARLKALCQAERVTAIHAIPQGMGFWHAFEVARELGLPYYLNVHDDLTYNLRGRPDLKTALQKLAQVWMQATGRMVISEAMGEEYCRRYGRQPYLIVTDGLSALPSGPCRRPEETLRVYFSGARHVSYEPNFRALLQALDQACETVPDLQVRFTSRGSGVPSMTTRYPIRVLPWATEQEVARDLEEADLLYLPLPFGKEYETFSRFSLSTKMVTYLGSGLPILYHGPSEAAAGRLLAQYEAALSLETLDPKQMAATLLAQRRGADAIVENALNLGRRQFWLADQRERFWKMLSSPIPLLD